MVGAMGAALSLISGGAFAADVPKLKCTRVGQSVIYRNQKFTCVKKGGSQLICNAHNSLFSAKDGELLRGPSSYGLARYTVTETGGDIFVTI